MILLPYPHVKISTIRNQVLNLHSFFHNLQLFFLQKRFFCVKKQYLMSTYLQRIVSIMNRKFTVNDFVTLPPCQNLSSQKSSFEFGLNFSHVALLLSQKHFSLLRYNISWVHMCHQHCLSGWNYPLAGLCQDLGQFSILAAVL